MFPITIVCGNTFVLNPSRDCLIDKTSLLIFILLPQKDELADWVDSDPYEIVSGNKVIAE